MRSTEVRKEEPSVAGKWNKGLKIQVPKSQIIQKKVVSESSKYRIKKTSKQAHIHSQQLEQY